MTVPGNTVDDPQSAQLDGLMFALSNTTFADVQDGLSNTAMLSELILTPDVGSDDLRGRYYNPACGNVLFSTLYPPNTVTPDRFRWCATRQTSFPRRRAFLPRTASSASRGVTIRAA